MRRAISFIVLSALLAFSMGGTCREETAQSVANVFLSEIAETAGEAIGDRLADPVTR
jgi:hypothetical protein